VSLKYKQKSELIYRGTTNSPVSVIRHCVDVCPYIHKANGDTVKKGHYKEYMGVRKKVGYRTLAWWPDDPPAVLSE